jgi:outer membrane protein assembly factor BamB
MLTALSLVAGFVSVRALSPAVPAVGWPMEGGSAARTYSQPGLTVPSCTSACSTWNVTFAASMQPEMAFQPSIDEARGLVVVTAAYGLLRFNSSTGALVSNTTIAEVSTQALLLGDGTAVVGAQNGEIVAVSLDGGILWSASTQSQKYFAVDLLVNPVTGDVIGCTDGGEVVALQSTNGSVRWDVLLHKFSLHLDPRGVALMPFANNTDAIIFGGYSCDDCDTVYSGLLASSGERLWNVSSTAIGGIVSILAVADLEVVVFLCGVTMEAYDVWTGALQWSYVDHNGFNSPPPLAHLNGIIYYGNRVTLTLLSAANGTQLATTPMGGITNFVVLDNAVCTCLGQNVTCFDPHTGSGFPFSVSFHSANLKGQYVWFSMTNSTFAGTWYRTDEQVLLVASLSP